MSSSDSSSTRAVARFEGEVPVFGQARLDFLQRIVRDHGDVVAFDEGGISTYLVAHPDDIHAVCVEQHRALHKDLFTRLFSWGLGWGLLTADGERWRRHRRAAAPAFTPEATEHVTEIVVSEVDRTLAALHGTTCSVLPQLKDTTMRVVLRSLFPSCTADSRTLGEAMGTILDLYPQLFMTPEVILPITESTPARDRLWATVDALDERLYPLVAQGRAEAARPPVDLLALLAHHHDGEGALSDVEVRDELTTFLMAAHETGALGMTYALMSLCQHPAVMERARAEVRQVLGARRPTHADLARLPYVGAVVREVLRLYPPAYLIGREAVDPVRIGEVLLPVGSQILVSQWVTHRDPRWFSDPEAFVPERWLAEGQPPRPRCAYFPYGLGPRVCIGHHLASAELLAALARILQTSRFEQVAPVGVPRLRPEFTLRPDEPIELRFEVTGEAEA